jgi:phosphatidylserine decarboxylase
MKIHREGFRILITLFLILTALNLLLFFISADQLFSIIILGGSILFYLFVVSFFRLPDRSMEADNSILFSPADGKVVVIEEVYEKEYFKDKRIQISIFMSPLNVHSNRYPVSGKVKYVKYHPGKYMVAWHPKSSDLNEHATVVVENENGVEILIRQIAGAVARRIVTYSKEGETVDQGGELGFIKFGSRVDIFLPLDSEIKAPFQEQVRANRSVIAKI